MLKRLLVLLLSCAFAMNTMAQVTIPGDGKYKGKHIVADGQVGADVRAFGARCDYDENAMTGTDDTAAFIAALNSLPLYTGTTENTTAAGNAVHVGFLFGRGKCLIANTISFGPRVGFIGLGWDAMQVFLKDNTWTAATMPTTTASITTGTKTLNFAGAIPTAFLHTNRVTITGAGASGANLVANVLTYDNYAHTITLDTSASTTKVSTTVAANDQIMFDVEPVMSGILGAGAVPTAASTFGTRFIGFKLNCLGGMWSGHNTACSAMRFFGAQGSKLDDIYIENFGMFGLHASGGSGTTANGTIWVSGGLGQAPGIQLDGANGFTSFALSCENVNTSGTYTDSEGDPVGCMQVNNSLFVSIRRFQNENNKLAAKFNNATAPRIDTLSIAPTAGGAGTGVILENGTNHACISFWESFRSSPDLFSTLIDDRVKNKKIPGNLVNNPNDGYCADPSFAGQVTVKSGQASATDGNKGSGPIRLEGSYYNGTAPQSTNFDIDNEVTSGTTPTSTLEITPTQDSGSTQQVRLNQLGAATSDGNNNKSSLPLCFRGASGTGSTTALPFMCMQYVLANASTIPLQEFAFTLGTSSGGPGAIRIPQAFSLKFGTTMGISFVTTNVLGVGNGTPGDMSGTFSMAALKQGTTNIAASGFVRMQSTGAVSWRNNANTADLALGKNSNDQLTFNSVLVQPLVASLTTTAAASDAVTLTGMTASGHCELTQTNASAATNVAATYVSAKTTNQITVTHTATAGMTYDVMCTPN